MGDPFLSGVFAGLGLGYLVGLWAGVRHVCKNLRAPTRYIPRSLPRVPRSQLPTLPAIDLSGLAAQCRREDTERREAARRGA